MSIPYRFNPLGISSGFNLEKGLFFHAPLQENFDAIGGSTIRQSGFTFQQRSGKNGIRYTTSYNVGSQGLAYRLDNFPGSGKPFTVNIWYNFNPVSFPSTSHDYDMVLFVVGSFIEDKAIGYQIKPTGYTGFSYPVFYAWKGPKSTQIYANNNALLGDNNWHCFTSVYDGMFNRNYNDGILISEYSVPTLNITSNQIYVGSRVGDGRFWRGLLNRLYIYNYALDEQQVKQFYNATK